MVVKKWGHAYGTVYNADCRWVVHVNKKHQSLPLVTSCLMERNLPPVPSDEKMGNLFQGLDDGIGILVGLGLAAEITGDVLRSVSHAPEESQIRECSPCPQRWS